MTPEDADAGDGALLAVPTRAPVAEHSAHCASGSFLLRVRSGRSDDGPLGPFRRRLWEVGRIRGTLRFQRLGDGARPLLAAFLRSTRCGPRARPADRSSTVAADESARLRLGRELFVASALEAVDLGSALVPRPVDARLAPYADCGRSIPSQRVR